MRPILIFAAIALAAGVYLARFADQTVTTTPAPQAAAVQADDQPMQVSAGQHRMEVMSSRDGHFRIDARVEGRHIDFLVDTGASMVVLRETSAASAGIRPMPRDYTATVTTANGKIKAAPTKLSRVQIGDITVFDVTALVLPDEALTTNLLGVSFLSKLRRYEYANGRMILEQ
jgi:aspartyl protease family protein